MQMILFLPFLFWSLRGGGNIKEVKHFQMQAGIHSKKDAVLSHSIIGNQYFNVGVRSLMSSITGKAEKEYV